LDNRRRINPTIGSPNIINAMAGGSGTGTGPWKVIGEPVPFGAPNVSEPVPGAPDETKYIIPLRKPPLTAGEILKLAIVPN